jgi:hypothetical protein
MATNACNLLYGKNDIKDVMLPWQPEIVVYCREYRPKGVLIALGIKHVWIYFESLGRFS